MNFGNPSKEFKISWMFEQRTKFFIKFEISCYCIKRNIKIMTTFQSTMTVNDGERMLQSRQTYCKLMNASPSLVFLETLKNSYTVEAVQEVKKNLCERWAGGRERRYSSKNFPPFFKWPLPNFFRILPSVSSPDGISLKTIPFTSTRLRVFRGVNAPKHIRILT